MQRENQGEKREKLYFGGGITLLEGSQATSIRPTDMNKVKEKMLG
jgi:hypothetical protein